MKKTIYSFLAIGLVAIFVLGACAPAAEAPVAQTEPPAVAPTEPAVVVPTEPAVVLPAEPVALTDAEMEALIAEKAHDKHTLEFILGQNKTAEEWSATLDKMIGYGAKISPEEKTLIIDWLVNRSKPVAVSLTDAEMEALIAEKAHDQHTLDFILSKDMTASEWSETLDRMIGYGAKISPEEKTLIIDWLVSRNK